MPKADAPKTVTVTEAELDAMIADRLKRSQRSPDEQKLRDLLAEVVDERLDTKLADFFGDDDPAAPPVRNQPRIDGDPDPDPDPDPKQRGGFLDGVLGFLKDDEPAAADA